MSTLAIAPIRQAELSGGLTLDDLIVGAWEGLAVHGPVACPVCDGEMLPAYGPHLRPVGGRCQRCESVLT